MSEPPSVESTVSTERSTADQTLRIAIVDRLDLTRDCIAYAVATLDFSQSVEVHKFAASDDLLASPTCFSTVLYHLHDVSLDIPGLQRLAGSDAPVIVLSPDAGTEIIRVAFDCGIKGYIPTRDAQLKLLLSVLPFINAGGQYIPTSVLSKTELKDRNMHGLTDRETLVLTMLAKGKQNKVIAYEMNVSESTVKVHIRNVLQKMRVKNRTEAVSMFLAMPKPIQSVEQAA